MIEWIIIGLLALLDWSFRLLLFRFQHLVEGISGESNGWIATLLAMRLRGVPVGMIVDARITAVKAGIPLGSINEATILQKEM